MRLPATLRKLPWMGMVVLLAALAGCAREPGGPYADAKQSWDTPRSTQQLDSLRNRLATTQQDH